MIGRCGGLISIVVVLVGPVFFIVCFADLGSDRNWSRSASSRGLDCSWVALVIITKINVNDREWPRIERNLYFLDSTKRSDRGRSPARVRNYDRYPLFATLDLRKRIERHRNIQRKTIIRKFLPIFWNT